MGWSSHLKIARPIVAPVAVLLAAVWCNANLHAAAAPEGDLAVYLDSRQSDQLEAAQEKLLSGDRGALAVTLVDLYRDDKTDTATRLRIIQLLGALKTDASAALLQKICTQNTITVLDVKDWPGLARAVQVGANADGSNPLGRMWKRLTEAERKSIAQVAAAGDAVSPEARPAQIMLLSALNRLLDDDTLFTENDATLLPQSDAVKLLLARWHNRLTPNQPPEARFTASEIRQLNDYLLQGLFTATLDSQYALPAYQYESRTANAAVGELMAMADQPVARAAIISLDPDPYQARKHIEALGAIRNEAATQRLFGYLKSEAVSASNRARDLLKTRAQDDGITIESAIEATLNRYMYADGKLPSMAEHVNRNLVAVMMALPNEATRRNLVDRCLSQTDQPLRDAAFHGLKLEPKLVRFEEIRKAVAERLEKDPGADNALDTIAILQLSEDPDSVPMVAAQLSHKNRSVRNSAARAMNLMTDKHLGNNPAVWKKWWNESNGIPEAEEAPIEDDAAAAGAEE